MCVYMCVCVCVCVGLCVSLCDFHSAPLPLYHPRTVKKVQCMWLHQLDIIPFSRFSFFPLPFRLLLVAVASHTTQLKELVEVW